MLVNETLKIVRALLKIDVQNIEIKEARIIAHSDPEKPEEWTNEYDILLKPRINHWTIQQIDRILGPFERVEMEIDDEGLRIFENELELKEES